jgi:hypothetical protein
LARMAAIAGPWFLNRADCCSANVEVILDTAASDSAMPPPSTAAAL